MAEEYILEMNHIVKAFSGVRALDDVNFKVKRGEIMAICGENGAGKSTLMNVLSGVYPYGTYEGDIVYCGETCQFHNIKESEHKGIVIIHQELALSPYLSVAENVFLGNERQDKGVIDWTRTRREAQTLLERVGMGNLNVNVPVNSLGVGQQQMIEIAKALMVDAQVIIMDEPTAALSQNETVTLFKVVRSLKEKGVSIVYISHRMEEIFELCDRITILRDGQYVGTRNIPETNMDEVVKMMIGREIGERYPERSVKLGDVVFEVKDLNCPGVFRDVNFSVRAGEVLGVAGLMGAGRTEIMQSIFGNMPHVTGQIFMYGKEIHNKNPWDAMNNGIGFITEDRKVEGLMLDKSIMENISVANLKRISNSGVLNSKLEQDMTKKGIEDLHIRCTGAQHACGKLSGGSQQKVVFAKWIFTQPKVLILDEPTRGVDIGAKKEIYSIINDLAGDGVAIIMVSSELPEVLGMSDRVMVVHEGEIGGFIDKENANQENIMVLATGGKLNG